MNKTKIEWTDYTWNPIKGICPVGCWYCYARKIYKRFKLLEKYGHGQVHRNGLYFETREAYNQFPRKPSKIFVCSTLELFHPDIPDGWRDFIFAKIERHPQHTFQILTKLPQNIDRPMPDNVYLGTSITSPDDFESRSYHLGKKEVKARVKFWSIEPLLGDILEPMLDRDGSWRYIAEEEKIRWIIIGRLTGCGHKYDPKWDWINRIVSYARHYHIPVFLKDNLIPIMGREWIMKFREFPREL